MLFDLLSPSDPRYPDALSALPQPPSALYWRGRTELLGLPAIAVVGSRSHSIYGRDATVSLVLGLARAGYVIVSGMARGIDGVAHQTALDVGGYTVAVLGCGIDVVYPPEHEELVERVAERGCLLTEFPPGTPPLKRNFPQRNRLIAGLARAVVVVEAAEKSGALITAGYALEEGKEVFAVPGPIHQAGSAGTNRLIQDGAALVTCAADIIQALASRSHEPIPPPIGEPAADDGGSRAAASPHALESVLAGRIWHELAVDAVDLESLTLRLGAGPASVSAALLELELSGIVERLPGPRYARARHGT